MAKNFLTLFKKMKIGIKYKKLMNQEYNICMKDDISNLIPGAKIKYYAQSTFHTIK